MVNINKTTLIICCILTSLTLCFKSRISSTIKDCNSDGSTTSNCDVPSSLTATCTIIPNNSGVDGEITLLQDPNCEQNCKIELIYNLTGVPSGQHATHFHSDSIQTTDLSTAGGHYSPTGDMDADAKYWEIGNMEPDENQNIRNELETLVLSETSTKSMHKNIKCSLKGEYSVIGRSIIIHEYYGNNEKGIDSGARIAGCNIIE